MDRSNHYEAAFEAYLRDQRFPFVPVDESRRCDVDDGTLKSLDFIVMNPDEGQLLIDIKGRRFPGGDQDKPRKVWQNWVTREDVTGLTRWVESVGDNATGLFVFVYWVQPYVTLPPGTDDFWCWRGKQYLMRAVEVGAYGRRMRTRSEKWGTVGLTKDDFREVVKPFRAFTTEPELMPAEGLRK